MSLTFNSVAKYHATELKVLDIDLWSRCIMGYVQMVYSFPWLFVSVFTWEDRSGPLAFLWCSTSKGVTLQAISVLRFLVPFFITSFIKVRYSNFTTEKGSKILFVFFIIFWMFSFISRKALSCKVPLLMCCFTYSSAQVVCIQLTLKTNH